jgi:SAM-dependent methyltransferase
MVLYKRKYKSYQQYVDHQSQKLEKNYERFRQRRDKRVESFVSRLEPVSPLIPGGKVLCLAARLGEEVEALRKLGHQDSVGIDLNPGPDNEYVVKGDFHDIPFGNAVFDGVYCNSLDHAWDMTKISSEAARVLKPGGLLILDVPFVRPFRGHDYRKNVRKKNKYESTLWDGLDDVLAQFPDFVEAHERVHSTTHKIIVLLRKKADEAPG